MSSWKCSRIISFR